jgi:hypothetical protein
VLKTKSVRELRAGALPVLRTEMVCVKVSPGCTLSRVTPDEPASAAATTVIAAFDTRWI